MTALERYGTICGEAGEIRVLEVYPGLEDDLINCDLHVSSLKDEQRISYWALSYAWGAGNVWNTISLDGESVLISDSLHSALRSLRLRKRSIRLWVDALCINQHDHAEKMSQIAQMYAIYHEAAKVIIWLGEEDLDSHDAFQFIKAIPSDCKMIDFLGSDTRLFRAVDHLLQRPWWTRIWVLQEVVAARGDPLVRCGSDVMVWSDLDCLRSNVPFTSWALFCLFMREKCKSDLAGDMIVQPRLDMFLELTDRLRCGKLLSFQEAASLALTMKATDPRDLVYALLGLMDCGIGSLQLQADYRLSEVSVRCRFSARDILSNDTFEGLTSTRGNTDSGLPSWLPNFHTGLTGVFLQSGTSYYNAAGETLPIVRWTDNWMVMHVNGVIMDEILEIAVDKPESMEISRQLAYRTGKRRGIDPRQTKDHYWRTVVANQGRSWSSEVVQYPAAQDLGLRYQASVHEIEVPESAIGPGERIEWYLEYYKPYYASTGIFRDEKQSTFFTTESGFFGLGQRGVLPGDSVCLLSGGKVLFVLRSHGSHYTFIGCAYVHGIMDGELAPRLMDESNCVEFEIH